jgi:hypothetical protein
MPLYLGYNLACTPAPVGKSKMKQYNNARFAYGGRKCKLPLAEM